MKQLLSGVSILFIFIGCASTGVVQMNQDSYFIGKTDSSFGGMNAMENKVEVFKEANEFCMKKGLEVQILKQTVTQSYPGHMGSTELNFRCVKPGGVAQPLMKEPDSVVNVNVNGLRY